MTDYSDKEIQRLADEAERGYDPQLLRENPGLNVQYPDAEAQGLVNEVMAARLADDPENEKAYDGSNNPPKRELTARERDILVRIIRDILRAAKENPPIFRPTGDDEMPLPYWDFSSVPITIGEGDFFERLAQISVAIDPRED